MVEMSQQQTKIPAALGDPADWVFCNEGNNNVVLRYVNTGNGALMGKVLRIRKATNREYYTDPCLLREDEYNTLMIDNVFRKDPILEKHLQDQQ
jgi:hypothetical protein